MTNSYFDEGDYEELSKHTTARSVGVNAIAAAVIAGFDKLPDPDALAEGRHAHIGTFGGTATALTCNIPTTTTSTGYTDGLRIRGHVSTAAAGATTVNVEGWGVKSLRLPGGTAISSGDWPADSILDMEYDQTNGYFILHSPPSAAVVGQAQAQADAAEDSATAAAASASAASASAGSASTSATTATTQASNASASATSAQNYAAAAAAAAGSNLFNTISDKSANFSVTADTDDGTMFKVNSASGNINMTLPSIATAGEGERYGIYRMSASNTITLVRNGSDTINNVAGNYTVPAVVGELTIIVADDDSPDNWIVFTWTQAIADETTLTKSGSTFSIKNNGVDTSQIAASAVTLAKMATAAKTQCWAIACSDETTALTTGTAKVTFRTPYAFTATDVRGSLSTAQTSGSIFTVDINESGTSILSTKLTIDNTEKTSTTAATAAVISDASLANDAEITIDIDQIGDGTAKGLKIYIIGYPT